MVDDKDGDPESNRCMISQNQIEFGNHFGLLLLGPSGVGN